MLRNYTFFSDRRLRVLGLHLDSTKQCGDSSAFLRASPTIHTDAAASLGWRKASVRVTIDKKILTYLQTFNKCTHNFLKWRKCVVQCLENSLLTLKIRNYLQKKYNFKYLKIIRKKIGKNEKKWKNLLKKKKIQSIQIHSHIFISYFL